MIALLLSPLGRAGLIAAGVVVFVALFAMDQQNRGAEKAVAKIDKANSHAVHQANSVRERSRNDTSGLLLDPFTITDNVGP